MWRGDALNPGPAAVEFAQWLRRDLGGTGPRQLAAPACADTLLRLT